MPLLVYSELLTDRSLGLHQQLEELLNYRIRFLVTLGGVEVLDELDSVLAKKPISRMVLNS